MVVVSMWSTKGWRFCLDTFVYTIINVISGRGRLDVAMIPCTHANHVRLNHAGRICEWIRMAHIILDFVSVSRPLYITITCT